MNDELGPSASLTGESRGRAVEALIALELRFFE